MTATNTIEGQELTCKHCNHKWTYRGHAEFKVTCPKCLFNVRLAPRNKEVIGSSNTPPPIVEQKIRVEPELRPDAVQVKTLQNTMFICDLCGKKNYELARLQHFAFSHPDSREGKTAKDIIYSEIMAEDKAGRIEKAKKERQKIEAFFGSFM